MVNQVRERAFGDSNHNYATVTLDDILLERRLELSWEMHNRQDDIRFGVYDKGMWAASNCVRKTDDYLKQPTYLCHRPRNGYHPGGCASPKTIRGDAQEGYHPAKQ